MSGFVRRFTSKTTIAPPKPEKMEFEEHNAEHAKPAPVKISRTQLLSEHAVAIFLVSTLYKKVFGSILRCEHSLGDGFYFIEANGKPISEETVDQLRKAYTDLLNEDTQIELLFLPRDDVIARFTEEGYDDKLGVLKAWQDEMIPVIKYGDLMDYVIQPMSTNKERLKIFELRHYDHGVLLRLPSIVNPTALREWKDVSVISKMFSEYTKWAHRVNVENIAKLNEAIYRGTIDKIRLVAEGLHEKKFAALAAHLAHGFDHKKVVTIAGPSSSNKTTFAKRLELQLIVHGYNATIIEMDDYFRDTADIPFGPDGIQDFEHISAMNVPLLAERVHDLLAGKEIPVRKFNFKEGKGVDDPNKKISLPPNTFLVLEGIHGLNPELLDHIGHDLVVPIYVSALTPLNIDHNHRFPTSDLRLIRRIIRDNQYRGQSPRMTIKRWTSVRMGEEKNIFPYQGNAEMFFNSSLVYELPVLSVFARVLLCEATTPDPGEDPNTPEAKEVSQEARRLLHLVNLFYPLSPEVVPGISCIREFMGNSDLDD